MNEKSCGTNPILPIKQELRIPLTNAWAVIPFPLSELDFDLLSKTLELWRPKLTGVERPPGWQFVVGQICKTCGKDISLDYAETEECEECYNKRHTYYCARCKQGYRCIKPAFPENWICHNCLQGFTGFIPGMTVICIHCDTAFQPAAPAEKYYCPRCVAERQPPPLAAEFLRCYKCSSILGDKKFPHDGGYLCGNCWATLPLKDPLPKVHIPGPPPEPPHATTCECPKCDPFPLPPIIMCKVCGKDTSHQPHVCAGEQPDFP